MFDRWRGEYNHIRPHEALGQQRPAAVYSRSRLPYPCKLVEDDRFYEPFSDVTTVDKNGFIKWHGRRVMVSSALRHERITFELDPDADGRWEVRWGSILIGILDDHHRDR